MLSFIVMQRSSIDNTLAPLEFILSVAGSLMLLIVVLLVPLTLFGGGSFLGMGDPVVCVTAPQSAVGEITGRGGINEAHVVGARSGVSTVARQIELCDSSPSAAQHVWAAVGTGPEFLYPFGFLGLAWHLTRVARRRGLFSPDVALAVGRLGLYVLIGAVAVSLLRMWADSRLIATMDRQSHGLNAALGFFHLSWAILFAGFGLLTVGRVMAQSVRMQREIDATV